MIELKNVTKIYKNGTEAISNLSLQINTGEICFIVGESGAGKSTLVKLLLREEKATYGEILVDGIDVVHLRRKDIPYYRRMFGVVFQDFRLFPNRTVFDNIAMAMRAVGKKHSEIKETIPRILSIVGLTGKEDCCPGSMSGGEQQRVALSRALANKPSYILADEPTGNIDPKRSREIMRMLRRIHQSGKTVIVVTHEKHLVEEFGGRVLQLEGGRLIKDETLPYRGEVKK